MTTTIRVTAADGTLYHVAATWLDDATQWWRIALLNNLTDPDLSGLCAPVPLVLPAPDGTQNSGVPGVDA